MVEWFSDFPKHFDLRADETGAQEAAFICKALGLRRGHTVLDAPCGAGRISIHLAHAGMNVTGVDLTSAYVQRARRRFRREDCRGKFICADLRAMDFYEQFDAAFNWQGSFGYFSDEENLDVIRRYVRSLRRGGKLLIDMPSREWLLRHFRGHGRSGDIEFSVRWRPAVQRTDTRFWNAKTGESWDMSIRHYTPAQYRVLFRQSGLELEALYGDLNAGPFDRTSRRIYFVGRKIEKRLADN